MNKNFVEKIKVISSVLMPLSLFSVAAALTYFTYEVSVISRQIPDILVRIDDTSEKIEPVIEKVADVVSLVPSILEEVEAIRELVPPILKEVEQTRAQIPLILKEIEQVREQIPPILKEVELNRQQIPLILDESAAIRKDLPAMLKTADNASLAVTDISQQIEGTNALIPEILKEVETTRESIPPLMDRADGLIENARRAGNEVSQGAVTGLFKGIIKAPFVLMGDAGRKIAGIKEDEFDDEDNLFNEKDFDLVEQTSLLILNDGNVREVKRWKNSSSGNHGRVELLSVYTSENETECRDIKITSYVGDEIYKEVERSLCKNDEDQWDFEG